MFFLFFPLSHKPQWAMADKEHAVAALSAKPQFHRLSKGRLNVLFAFCKKNQKADGATPCDPRRKTHAEGIFAKLKSRCF